MARSRESKIELTAYDDLFQTDESREEAKLSKIRDIPIAEIDEFPDHPFKVLMDEDSWLAENAHKYGFIKRYPSDKTDITGVINEPWHYRYVGKEAALEIYSQGMCLEEYIDTLE